MKENQNDVNGVSIGEIRKRIEAIRKASKDDIRVNIEKIKSHTELGDGQSVTPPATLSGMPPPQKILEEFENQLTVWNSQGLTYREWFEAVDWCLCSDCRYDAPEIPEVIKRDYIDSTEWAVCL